MGHCLIFASSEKLFCAPNTKKTVRMEEELTSAFIHQQKRLDGKNSSVTAFSL